VPVLLFSFRLDSELARTALLADAHGLIHGMQLAQVARALSVTSEDEIVVSREPLGVLLVEMKQRAYLNPLTPHQGEILQRLSVATFGSEISGF
jgi:hypothetical protein